MKKKIIEQFNILKTMKDLQKYTEGNYIKNNENEKKPFKNNSLSKAYKKISDSIVLSTKDIILKTKK